MMPARRNAELPGIFVSLLVKRPPVQDSAIEMVLPVAISCRAIFFSSCILLILIYLGN